MDPTDGGGRTTLTERLDKKSGRRAAGKPKESAERRFTNRHPALAGAATGDLAIVVAMGSLPWPRTAPLVITDRASWPYVSGL